MAGAVGQRVLINEAVEMLFECAGHFARTTGARAIPQALGSLSGKALDPLSQGRIGKVEGLGSGFNVMALDHGTDGLRPAKDPGLLGLFEHGLEGRQGMSGKLAFEGAYHFLLAGA
jgi:hypothetical protein